MEAILADGIIAGKIVGEDIYRWYKKSHGEEFAINLLNKVNRVLISKGHADLVYTKL